MIDRDLDEVDAATLVTAATGMSSGTLYKRAGSRTALRTVVLTERDHLERSGCPACAAP
jgi:hypothetical protein